MKAKTIFIIVLTALVTIILMKNMDEVEFWIFGVHSIPKLAVLGTMFVIGVAVGLMLRKRKKHVYQEEESTPPLEINPSLDNPIDPLDDEDKNYIN